MSGFRAFDRDEPSLIDKLRQDAWLDFYRAATLQAAGRVIAAGRVGSITVGAETDGEESAECGAK